MAKRIAAGPSPSPDGLSLGARLKTLMKERGISKSELARICSSYYAALAPQRDTVSTQHIADIIDGQDSSWVSPLIAAVFDVPLLWLQLGIGRRSR
jgi:transcriptional regulator with XRE-family HTH domain